MINSTNRATQASLTRRRALQAFGLLGVGALTACAGPGSGGAGAEGAAGPTPPATGEASGDVSFAHWRGEDKETFDRLIKKFLAENPEVKITQNISPSNNYQSQALQRLRGGGVGDVFPTFRGAQFASFEKAGIYTDLSETEMVQNYQSDLIGAGQSADGKQLGLPYQVVFSIPVANSEIFDEAGAEMAPPDWNGFMDNCDKLKTAGYIPLAWPGGEAGNAGHLFNCLIPNEAPVDDMCAQIEAGKLKCTDDWFISMLEKYKDLRPFFQSNSTGTSVEPAQQLFASKKAAMLATGDFHITAVRNLGATFPVDLSFPVTTTAEKAKYEGVYNATFILGVNAESDVQPAATAWLNFLSQPGIASEYANSTAQHLSVKGLEYTNEDLKATQPWLSKKTALAARFQFDDLDMRNAVEASGIAVVGGAKPEQAAEEAQKVVDQRI